MIDSALASADYGYLTTTGRRTGREHTVEIWFATAGDTLYLLSGSGGTSDWCRNLDAVPAAGFTIDGQAFRVTGRRVTDPAEDEGARDLVVAKYQPGYGSDLSEWRRLSAVFALDVVT